MPYRQPPPQSRFSRVNVELQQLYHRRVVIDQLIEALEAYRRVQIGSGPSEELGAGAEPSRQRPALSA